MLYHHKKKTVNNNFIDKFAKKAGTKPPATTTPPKKEKPLTPSETEYQKAVTQFHTDFADLAAKIAQLQGTLQSQTEILNALVESDKKVHNEIPPTE